MNYNIKTLENIDFTELYKTSVEAFADYAVDMSYMTEDNLRLRCIKNNVDFTKSVAAFYENKMVGYTLVGIDDWQGTKTAFDAGTGIIKDHRGKGLAGKMFDFSLAELKKAGVKAFLLEVLQVNQPAIKAYQKAGFKITREFKCYQIKTSEVKCKNNSKQSFHTRRIDKTEIQNAEGFINYPMSWETRMQSVNRIPDEIISFSAFNNSELVGTLTYYPSLNWIMSILTKKGYNNQGVEDILLNVFFTEYKPSKEIIKFINIDSREEELNKAVKDYGFDPIVDQYEMKLDL